MTTNLDTAVTEIAKVVNRVAGINAAPAYPPESMTESVFAITYIQAGDLDIASEGSRHSLWDINIDVLCVRNNLTRDMKKLLSILDPLKDAIAAEVSSGGDQFTDSIETFRNLHCEFVPDYTYQGVQYVGYRYTMQGVKFIEYP
jgi:hypothetical protein